MSPNISSVIHEILAIQRASLSSDVVTMDAKKLETHALKSLLKFLELYKKHIRDKVFSKVRIALLPSFSAFCEFCNTVIKIMCSTSNKRMFPQ